MHLPAFLSPITCCNPKSRTSFTSSTSSHPIRLSSFIPNAKSLRVSPLWRDALRRTESPPLVFVAPIVASLKVDTTPPQILISGAPASGKGTQCEYIVSKYGVVHISTGDMLRAAVKAETNLGKQAKAFMDSGKLVPDDLVISMLKERITQDDCKENGWLLDGFPRTAVQAQALTDANILPSAVVVLDVKDEALIERVVGRRSDPVTGKIYHTKFSPPTDPEVMQRLTQRSDDTEEKARVRLETYYKHAKSIQDHYATMLSMVDGNRSKGEVFNDISSVIDAAIADNDEDNDGDAPSSISSKSPEQQSASSSSTKGIPVAEFVRRAEEAYEKSVLQNEEVQWSGQAGVESAESAGTSSYEDIFRRLDLAIGDAIAFLTFAYIGRRSHGDAALDFDVFKTAAPFLVAWFGTSPLLGAYTRQATANLASTLKMFARSWAVSVPMGIALRGVVTERVPPAAFAVITLVSTFVIVGAWRAAYVKIKGDETDEGRKGGPIEGVRMITTLLKRW